MANLPKPFESYYDRVLGATITSQRQKERLMKKVKNSSHPQGIYDIRDDKKFLKEQAYIQAHREEFKAATMAGYKPKTERELNEIRQKYGGERVYNPDRPDFDQRRHRS